MALVARCLATKKKWMWLFPQSWLPRSPYIALISAQGLLVTAMLEVWLTISNGVTMLLWFKDFPQQESWQGKFSSEVFKQHFWHLIISSSINRPGLGINAKLHPHALSITTCCLSWLKVMTSQVEQMPRFVTSIWRHFRCQCVNSPCVKSVHKFVC